MKEETAAKYNVNNDEDIIAQALAILRKKVMRKGVSITDPQTTKDYLTVKYIDKPNEVFGAIWLDNRHRIIEIEEMFYGTLDGCSVHNRVVAQSAFKHNAAAVIFFHNHPSGNPEPSRADETVTNKLKEILNMIEVRVLDHFIIGETVTSFAERGLI
jgi:DNA repair protein RadC